MDIENIKCCCSQEVLNLIMREVLPMSLGGNGRQKALALIGDRVLDVKLYQRLLIDGDSNEGLMTQRRSMIVANKNLARCGEMLLVPCLLSKKDYLKLSQHEKGTIVEAYIGAIFEHQHYKFTEMVDQATLQILDILTNFLKDEVPPAEQGPVVSQFKTPIGYKKSKSSLLELLQKRGVNHAASFFSTKSANVQSNLPPFISTFSPNFCLNYCGLPDTGTVDSDPCVSKKEAEENVASKILQFFLDRERKVLKPLLESMKNQKNTEATSDGNNTNVTDTNAENKSGEILVETATVTVISDGNNTVNDDKVSTVEEDVANGKSKPLSETTTLTTITENIGTIASSTSNTVSSTSVIANTSNSSTCPIGNANVNTSATGRPLIVRSTDIVQLELYGALKLAKELDVNDNTNKNDNSYSNFTSVLRKHPRDSNATESDVSMLGESGLHSDSNYDNVIEGDEEGEIIEIGRPGNFDQQRELENKRVAEHVKQVLQKRHVTREKKRLNRLKYKDFMERKKVRLDNTIHHSNTQGRY
jgi:hypothetical protein